MKLALGVVFWVTVAPAVFFLLLDMLVLPVRWAIDSTWYAESPAALRVGVQCFAVVAILVSGRVTWLLWRRFQAVIQVEPALRSRTWIDRLSPALRLVLSLSVLLAGTTIVTVSVATQPEPSNLRTDFIYLGGLFQGAGVIGILLALRSRSAA